MLAIRKILHPTDFSPTSEAAFRFAASLARDYGAKLILLHTSQTPALVYGEGFNTPLPQDHWEALLDRLMGLVARDNVKVPVDPRLADGDPATEILRIAAEEKVDVIVMGTHGHTGLARLLMGSVAEAVSRRAACPVLTVKTPAPETQASEAAATTQVA